MLKRLADLMVRFSIWIAIGWSLEEEETDEQAGRD